MSTLSLPCSHLLLDASTVISLYAGRRMQTILRSLPMKAAVVDLTCQQEILYIWGGSDDNVRVYKEEIDLQPLFDCNLLVEVSLENDEYTTMVNLAACKLGNGESAATAVALHRGWGVCTDDYQALSRIYRVAPGVPCITTSAILRHWAITTQASDADIRAVIQAMHRRGGYGCGEPDGQAAWVQQYLES